MHRGEEMGLGPPLDVTPEGSLTDIPTAVEREKTDQVPEEGMLGTSSETTYMEIPNPCVKTVSGSPKREAPKIIQRTKEASREEVIASTHQFFAAVDRRNASITARSQLASTEVQVRDVVEVPDIPTTTVATTTSTTTSPVTLDVEPRGISSPRISLPKGSPSHPTVTATCRPRTWMQQLTEGQTTEPRREDASSSESNTFAVERLPEDIPDELGHKWRVLHPFEPPAVRFPTDTMPQIKDGWLKMMHWWNLSKQQNIWMMYPPGDKEIIDFTPLNMVILSTEGEIEEEVEVEEEDNGFRKGRWIDLMEDSERDIPRVMV